MNFYKQMSVNASNYEPVESWYSHSGDMGDTIAGLPAIMLRQGGHLRLTPSVGLVRDPWHQEKVEQVRSFLELQPYIYSVSFGTCAGTNLDKWREQWGYRATLMSQHLNLFNLTIDPERPWLIVDEVKAIAPIVINRTSRYPGARYPWAYILKRFKSNIVFCGTPEEHQEFCLTYGQVPYYPTPTLLDLARVIAGSQLFCGNQSAARMVAEGLKVNVHVEEHRGRRSVSHVDRTGASYNGDTPRIIPCVRKDFTSL